MCVVNEGHQSVSFAFSSCAPCVCIRVEVKANYRAIVFRCDGVAGCIAVHEITTILTVNYGATLSNGVGAVPEFN